MGTSTDTIAHLLGHLAGAGALSARKMFGEYALYLDGKVVGFVCDDQLFIKPTEGAHALLGTTTSMAPAYPGSKLYFLIDAALDDLDLMHQVLRRVADDQPPQKPKKRPAKS